MRTMKFGLGVFLMLVSLGGMLVAAPARAAALSGNDFRANNIIDDGTFFNRGTMNTGDIQNFLNSKVAVCQSGYTCLKDYSQSFGGAGADSYCGGITGGNKSAANIIFDVGQACGINPQTLIVLLQKEQGLVTNTQPTDTHYRIAAGYGCPDTAPCDAEYYGFFNQMYNAAHQFKRYIQQPQSFNYAAGRTSYVQYNPNSGCGGSNVNIQNQATAALYNYTPYQPNAAALSVVSDSSPGGTVNCGAYGNRNFWWYFNKWFGASIGDNYMLGRNIDDNSQWVIYRGVKQYVPSAEIKQAWGLPDDTVPMSGTYLAGIPTGPNLGRLFHLIGDPALYFADGGKKYYIGSQQMKTAWGLNGQTESFVSRDLWNLPQNAGYLSYSVKNASNPALYMIDGLNGSGQMVLRQYGSPDVFHAWEGDNGGITTVSDTLFSQIDDAIGTGLSGYTAKSSTDPNQYQVISGQKLYLSGGMAAVYGQTYQTVSQMTIDRLVPSSPVTDFIRLPGDGVTIYMVDNGQKLPIGSVDVLKAWSPGGGAPAVNVLNQGFLNLLTTGPAINSYEADVGGQLYLMDGQKIPVAAGLDSAYRTGTVVSPSAALMSLFATAGNATGFIKASGPAVYLMDSGALRHIPSTQEWQLWNGSRGEALTTVSNSVLAQFSSGSDAQHYFSAGGINYVIDNGTYHSVAAGVATDWGLSGPTAMTTATRNRFTAGAALSQKAKVGSSYYQIKYGKNNGTSDPAVANIWGIDSSPVDVTGNLIATTSNGPGLSIYAKSTDLSDNRIFLVDNGAANFYHIVSVEQLLNYGYNGDPIPAVTPADLGTITNAPTIIKTATANSERVLDAGQKRDFANGTIKGRWLTGSNSLTVSSALWGHFANGAALNGNIKSSAPNVYTVDTGQKRWLQSQASYQSSVSQYGAYSGVSDWLTSVLPTGSNIP